MNTKKIGAIIATIVVAGGVIFTAASTVKIKNGHVGVIYSIQGGVQDEVLGQGWKFVGPTKKVIQYSIRTQQLYMSKDSQEGSEEDESLNVGTQGGTVNVDFEMSYSFNSETVANVYKKYGGLSGKEIVDTIVRGRIRGLVNEVTSQYTVAEVYIDKRQEVNERITEHLRENLKEIGINVERASLPDVRPDASVLAALTERSKVAQELENEKQRQEKIRLEAESKKIQAQGEADAMLIKAQAEADANRILSESLTDNVLKQMEIEKWNGSNATTVVNGTESTVVTPGQ